MNRRGFIKSMMGGACAAAFLPAPIAAVPKGPLSIEGTITCYFNDKDVYDHMIDAQQYTIQELYGWLKEYWIRNPDEEEIVMIETTPVITTIENRFEIE